MRSEELLQRRHYKIAISRDLRGLFSETNKNGNYDEGGEFEKRAFKATANIG